MEAEVWPVDDVPKEAILYVRVHNGFVNKKGPSKGLPNEGAFYNTPKQGPDLSSDWNKYSSPQRTREQIGREYKSGKTEYKNSLDFFIASFVVEEILNLDIEQRQVVEHTPRQDNFPNELQGYPWNRAHCSIIGNDEERRVKMAAIVKWEIPPPEYNQEQDPRVFNH